MGGLTFRMSSDGKKIQAAFDPAGGPPPGDEAEVRELLEDAGFADCYLPQNALTDLSARCAAASRPFTIDVGERRDGTFTLSLSPDLMAATVTITPPYGGKAVTASDLYRALKEHGVVSGIKDDTIKQITTACRALNKPIAAGRPPGVGADGQLASLIPEIKDRTPRADDEESAVDYRDLGGIVSVTPGTPLMRRIPPTVGEPGENIRGATVPGIEGKDLTFAPQLPGTAFAPDDPDLLVAAIAGQPVLVSCGVTVEPTVKVKSIDLSTGNITFEGTLVISGDIAAGMAVKASGDIVVGGTVEAAVLDAGGNVEIKGGAIFSHIHAGGSISALFAEKAHLHAGGNVFLKELCMLSELKAGGQVVIGEKGMKKGHIIGGLCRAATLVKAIVAGSQAGAPTRIEVGVDPETREKLAAVRQQLDQKNLEAEEVHKALVYLREKADPTGQSSIKEKEERRDALEMEIADLVRQKKRLQKRLETVANARVEVERTTYYGVQIVIGETALLVDDDVENAVFRIEDEVIVH